MATELANPQTDRPALTPEGQRFEISKAVTFEAAHRMPGRAAGDPYGRIHGHSFRIEATISGTVSPGEQWVADFADLTAALEKLTARLDHQMLNDIAGLEVPTLERIALWAADQLKADLPALSQLTVSRPSLTERCTLKIG